MFALRVDEYLLLRYKSKGRCEVDCGWGEAMGKLWLDRGRVAQLAGQGQDGTIVISCWDWVQKLLGSFVL